MSYMDYVKAIAILKLKFNLTLLHYPYVGN